MLEFWNDDINSYSYILETGIVASNEECTHLLHNCLKILFSLPQASTA